MVDKGKRVDRAGRLMYGPGGKLIPIEDRVFPEPTVAKDVEVMPAKGVALGHKIVHATSRSQIHLTPIMSMPIPIPTDGSPVKICPTCQVNHPVKTLHIYVDDVGCATVSGGVLLLLKGVGMDGYTQQGHTDNPPPLKIGQGKTRKQMDYSNRAQVIYSPGKPKNPPQVTLPGSTTK